jgi:hypothetical protein
VLAGIRRLPSHAWLGLALVAVFWPLNWVLDGLRTQWAFFPLWLGYGLTVDGINVARRGTSLLTRSRWRYAGLFLVSAPAWWVFEAINLRTGNWVYVGREHFSDLEYALLASLSFSTVVPAVLGTAELFAGLGCIRRLRWRARLPADPPTLGTIFALGVAAFALLMAWPRTFYPFVWLSLVSVLEPLNARLGNRSLTAWTRVSNWRPVAALALGALACGFFWELWNYYSYPKWVYRVPVLGFWHIFEMPLLGYLGYVPFSWELFALVHLAFGIAGDGRTDYVTRGLDPGNQDHFGLQSEAPDPSRTPPRPLS